MSEYTKTYIVERELIEDVLSDFKTMKADHVSKSELRAWCEAEENHHKYYDDYYQRDVEVVYLKEVLEKFCKGEK